MIIPSGMNNGCQEEGIRKKKEVRQRIRSTDVTDVKKNEEERRKKEEGKCN
ncbi:hypothetical protein QUA20_25630 [Microcoleus sp. Pol7_A1]|uniref:hypothetical protein n=1 Tax=Microcoleus sp. Pol7_A1 TaxID=2818893 RepID=UPI002FD5F067